MKTIFAAAFIIVALLIAVNSPAAGNLATANNGALIQGCDFDGAETVALTVNSTTRDNTNYACFSIYSPTDCRIRLMTTSSKTGSVSDIIPGGQFQTIVTNKLTPFANLSGCTGGIWRRNSPKLP